MGKNKSRRIRAREKKRELSDRVLKSYGATNNIFIHFDQRDTIRLQQLNKWCYNLAIARCQVSFMLKPFIFYTSFDRNTVVHSAYEFYKKLLNPVEHVFLVNKELFGIRNHYNGLQLVKFENFEVNGGRNYKENLVQTLFHKVNHLTGFSVAFSFTDHILFVNGGLI